MAAAYDKFRTCPKTAKPQPSTLAHDYLQYSGRYNDRPLPYICCNSGTKCCQEGKCKPPEEPLKPSFNFMSALDCVRLANFAAKRFTLPSYKMVSKYNPEPPFTQPDWPIRILETVPPFSPMMTVSHLDYRDFTDDDLLLKQYKANADRARKEEDRKAKIKMREEKGRNYKGFYIPWCLERYGNNILFDDYPNALQWPEAPKTGACIGGLPTTRSAEAYRQADTLNFTRKRIRRFPPV